MARLALRPSRLRSLAAAVAASVVVAMSLVGCGSDASSEEAFCTEAKDFQEFQQVLGLVLFDPAQTEEFFQESVERIESLAESAPPTVAADVDAVRDGFIELDAALAAADYNVLLVPEEALDTSGTDAASERIDEFLQAACRGEDDPIGGFGEDPLAPPVLSVDEIDDLQDQVDEESGDLEQLVAEQLADEFGLAIEDAECLVAELDVSLITSLAGGDPITAETTETFLAALVTCDISVTELGQ